MIIDKFLGRTVEIPEDLKYDAKQGLWGRREGAELVFGLAEPTLVLVGAFVDLSELVNEGESVEKGRAIGVAITTKLKYLEAPVAGTIRFNRAVSEDPGVVVKDPYGDGLLFRIRPEVPVEQAWEELDDPETYLESLKQTEGFKNREGVAGGSSSMCKAVYHSIKTQKF